jgi:hypothetical protein
VTRSPSPVTIRTSMPIDASERIASAALGLGGSTNDA